MSACVHVCVRVLDCLNILSSSLKDYRLCAVTREKAEDVQLFFAKTDTQHSAERLAAMQHLFRDTLTQIQPCDLVSNDESIPSVHTTDAITLFYSIDQATPRDCQSKSRPLRCQLLQDAMPDYLISDVKQIVIGYLIPSDAALISAMQSLVRAILFCAFVGP